MTTNTQNPKAPPSQNRAGTNNQTEKLAAIERQCGGGELVGKFFHSIVEDKVQWQGFVIGRPEPGWYLLQLYSWLMGEYSNQQLVRIEEMHGWLFYPDGDAMAYSYDYGVAHSHRADVRKKEGIDTP